jgi:hypothetical protein
MTGTYRGTTTVDGGMEDGEVFKRSMLNVLGDEVALLTYDPEKGRFVQADRLITAKVDIDDDRGEVTATGLSQFLLSEVKVSPAEARITWTMKTKGCQTC